MKPLATVFFLTFISSLLLVNMGVKREASAEDGDGYSTENGVLYWRDLKNKDINTCSGLQEVANKIWAEDQISFQGFEKKKVNHYYTPRYMDHPGGTILAHPATFRICKGGYVTSISPLGKRVCEGTLLAFISPETKEPKYFWAPGYDMDTSPPGLSYLSRSYSSTLGNYPTRDEARYCRYVS